MESAFLLQYHVKTFEYLLSITYLLCFVCLWRYLSFNPNHKSEVRS